MAEPLEFRSATRREAYERQWRRCAHCGVSLGRNYGRAHHVFPNQTEDPENPSHDWLDDVANCVVLCAECDVKLYRDGRFRVGAVSPAGDFPFSHGPATARHNAWAAFMRKKFFGGDQ